MPFGKELSHLIEEQINKSVESKNAYMDSTSIASRSGGDEGRIAQLEANLQKLGEKFTSFLGSQKKSKRTVVDYGLTVIALHELRLAVTAGRAIFIDRDEPVDMPYTYLQLSSAGSERQIRYIYLDSTGVILESTTDPTNIGTGYVPLAMVDVWTGITEITQDKITDIRPRTGTEENNSNTQNNLELSGNVTLYSPDTGNDSFVVSAANPASLKVKVTSGRALVNGEMLNAEGGLLDLISHRNVDNEFIAFSDGVTKIFNLYHKSVSNVVVYVNDVSTAATVAGANGSIAFAVAPVQDAKITVSYTFGGNYMLVFLVERAQTNDGKSFGIIGWKVGSNRVDSKSPDLASYQHAIAKVDMSSAITAITDAIIDNSYEIKNLTQYDLQFGGKLDGSSLKAGAITSENLDSSMQSSIAAIDQLKIGIDNTNAAVENAKTDINTAKVDLSKKYTELTQTANDLKKTDDSIASTVVVNKTDIEGKLSNAVTKIMQTTDGITSSVVSNKKDADDKISQFTQKADSITSTIAMVKADIEGKLNADPANSQYKAISQLKQTVDGISSTVSTNKTDADGKISALKQTADNLTSIVASNKTTLEGNISSAVSQIKQTTDSISSTVSNIKVELGKPIDQCSYTAITQAKDAINLRVKSSDFTGQNMVSQINVSPAGTLIDGKMLHVTGQTVFDDNVIVGGMLQAGSVNAAKIIAGAIQSSHISANAIRADMIQGGTISADKFESTTWGDMSQAMRFVKNILGGAQSWRKTLSKTDLDIGEKSNVNVQSESFPAIKLDTQRHWDDGLTWDASSQKWDIPVVGSGYWESASIDYGAITNLQAEFWAKLFATDPAVMIAVKGRYSNDNLTWTNYEKLVPNEAFGYHFWVGSLQSFRYIKIRVEFTTADTTKYALLVDPEVRAANCQIGTEDIADGSITLAKLSPGLRAQLGL